MNNLQEEANNFKIQELKKALKMTIMDVDNFIKVYKLLPVTSHGILDQSGNFDVNGLFSEVIFGEANSPARYTTLGYINLYANVLHPYIYRKLINVNSLYKNIIDCTKFVKFDSKIKDFILSEPDESNSNTGLTYFLKYIKEVDLNKKYKETTSLRRKADIKLLQKYKERWIIDKLLVLPAGIRDIQKDQTRISKDSINNTYLVILALSKSFEGIPKKELESPIFNTILATLQTKIQEVFNTLYGLLEGKYGFLQRKLGAKSVTLTSRNTLIAATTNVDSPDDPSFLSAQELHIPLIEVLKDLTPTVMHYFSELFNSITRIKHSKHILAINPKTLEQEYIDISIKEQEKFTTEDKLNSLINSFRNEHFRKQPIMIKSTNKKEYGFLLVYDNIKTDSIYLSPSFSIIKSYFPNITKEDVRFITYHEFMYMVGVKAADKKAASLCRYPTDNKWSHQEGFIKIATTKPFRQVELKILFNKNSDNIENKIDNSNNLFNSFVNMFNIGQYLNKNTNKLIHGFNKIYDIKIENNNVIFYYYAWPDIYNGSSINAVSLPNIYLGPMTADMDGDQLSLYPALTNESNEELNNHINNISRFVDINEQFTFEIQPDSYRVLKYMSL